MFIFARLMWSAIELQKYYFDRLTKEKIFSELNLSNNRISTLPEEIAECTQLEKIDISQVVNFRDPKALVIFGIQLEPVLSLFPEFLFTSA